MRRSDRCDTKGIQQVRLCHTFARSSARFDDPNLVSAGGWCRCWRWPSGRGCAGLVAEHVTVPTDRGRARRGEGAGAGRGDGRRRGLHRGHGPAAARRDGAGCSPGSGRRRRWARSCARSPSGMSGSSTRSPPGCWSSWPSATPLLPGAAGSPTSTSMTRSGRPTATPSRAPGTATPGSRGSTRCWRRCRTPAAAPVIVATRLRKGSANSARGAARLVADALVTARAVRRERAAGAARRLRVLRPRRDRRRPPRRRPVLGHRPQGPGGPPGDRRHPRGGVDDRSATRTRSSTSSCSSGSPTPRSPRSPFTAFTSRPQGRAGHRAG